MCHHLHVFTQVFPHLTGVQVHTCQVGPTQLSLAVSSAASCACCPVCHHWSWRIHSRFLRTFADLPSAGRGVVLRFCGRRFFVGIAPVRAVPSASRSPRLLQLISAIPLRFIRPWNAWGLLSVAGQQSDWHRLRGLPTAGRAA